ncbi:MAG: EamA-like transporter family/Multidrug resistance efflux transporter [Marinobacter excellens HL-55]|uniref:EamA-like transporter family/Multidrug resistance efflux transporter n=1 Tax=Marinobacter excellens HL-55 TaxID=1305731 RepID=A0A0N8KK39_9GAMM|nr:MAG: EamA-like transporter family/Multidrug resistance efflux transporter [Marinobacter excellens HL-55]
MTSTAIIIVLVSALAHAGWNLFGKKVSPSGAFFWYSTLWGALLTLPVLVYYHPLLRELGPDIWWLVVATGFFQATYLSCLAAAYRHGELSVVYPLARSSPLLILLVGTLFLGTAETITGAAVAGIVLIVGGCIILPMQRLRDFRLANYRNLATLFALLAAASTAGYSIVDDNATDQMRDLLAGIALDAEVALVFVILQAWSALVWLSLGLGLQATERRLLRELVTNWRSTMAAGVLILGTYALVVWAMAYADDVSYVVAFRQVSIPIGVALGWYFLGEPLRTPKILGVLTILAGLLLVVLG